MNIKKLALFLLLPIINIMLSCNENIIDETSNVTSEPKLVSVDCEIGNGSELSSDFYSDCLLMSIVEQKQVNSQDTKINVNQNECVQRSCWVKMMALSI